MRFSITKLLASYTARVTLAGTRLVARAEQRARHQREAEREAAQAEKEWWENILRQDAEDQRREFHEHNAEWAIEAQKYEEEVMKKQDQELNELKEKEEQYRDQGHIKAMRQQAYLFLTENTGQEDQDDTEDDEFDAPSANSFPPPYSIPPRPVPLHLLNDFKESEPLNAIYPHLLADLAEAAATGFILKAQLERRVYIPWWTDFVDV